MNHMWSIIVATAISYSVSLHGMQEKNPQKPFSLTVYSGDAKRSLVPLSLIEKTSLYEQLCKKRKNKEDLFLTTSITNKDLTLFVNTFHQPSPEKSKQYYDSLTKKEQKLLINAAGFLKSAWATAKLLDYYIEENNINMDINAMLMKSAAECIRYRIIRLNAAKKGGKLTSESTMILRKNFKCLYKGDGSYHIAPQSVIKNGTAAWDGLLDRIYIYKKGKNYYATHLLFKNATTRYTIHSPQPHQNKILSSPTFGKDFFLIDEQDTIIYHKQHTDAITKCIFSRNGKWLVSGSGGTQNNLVYRYLPAHWCIWKSSYCAGVSELCFNHQSTLLVVGFDTDKDNCLLLLAPQNQSELRSDPARKFITGHSTGIYKAEFSADDRRLLTCSYNKTDNQSTLILWNASDYDDIHHIAIISENGHIIKLLFSPTGDKIVAMTGCGNFFMYDGHTGEKIASSAYSDDNCSTPSLTFSRDGKFFLTMTTHESDSGSSKAFKLWDSKTGENIGYLPSTSDFAYAGGFTPRSRYIIDVDKIASADGSANFTQLYSHHDNKKIQQIATHETTNSGEAYHIWRACKAAEDGEVYDDVYCEKIKNIIMAYTSVLKKT
jgi:WD40 repeat protein